MVIGLFGFSFEDRNKGCEALTYSFISILNELIPDNLTVINLSGIGDSKELEKIFPKIHFEITGFQKKKISINSFKELLKCDVVFDCTFGDNFSDIYSRSFVNKTTLLKEMTLCFRKPFVLAPQTIGPFNDKRLIKRVIRILKKSDIVYSRDVLSAKYVKTISGVDPVITTDLAFLLPYDKKIFRGEKRKVGINVSGLLWAGGFNGENQFDLKVDYKQYITELIKYLKFNTNTEVHLIPHVLDYNKEEIDNDLFICEELSEKFEVKFSGSFLNPVEAKNYISGMDYFVGARMHSTVAAFSSGVVTIPFSYSRKFEGLYATLEYNYIIDGKKLATKDAINQTIGYIEQSKELALSQKKALNRIDELEKDFIKSLREYLGNFT